MVSPRQAFPRLAVSLCVAALALALPVRSESTQATDRQIEALFEQGRYAEATVLARKALADAEREHGPDDVRVAPRADDLAVLLKVQGQYAEAEALYLRALALFERHLGPAHPDVAKSLSNLSALHYRQGRYDAAEPLARRALEIREKALGPDHLELSYSLNNLALVLQALGQPSLARPLLQRAIAIREKAAGPEHPGVGELLSNLASLEYEQRDYEAAVAHLRRALEIREKALGPDHPGLAVSLNNLAAVYEDLRRYAESEALYRRALANGERALGPDHPDLTAALDNLALLYMNVGEPAKALAMARRSSAIYRERIVARGMGVEAAREAAENRPGIFRHLRLLSLRPAGESAEALTDESFQVGQLLQASGTASAVARMAARIALGDDGLANLVRAKQDAVDRQARLDAQLLDAVSLPPAERDARGEGRLREEIAATARRVREIDESLARAFPAFRALERVEPLTVPQVRELLGPDEAMLVYAFDGRSFAWVVRREGAHFEELQVDAKALAETVAKVRAQMVPDDEGRSQPVRVDLLHGLYRSVLAPLKPRLAGVKHLIVVPAGPLQGLPLQLLAVSPGPPIARDADYRGVDWLARHYAISVLPSVASIQALRAGARPRPAPEPFAGFGDPLTGGAAGASRGKASWVASRGAARSAPAGAGPRRGVRGPEVADVQAIRGVPRLPETAAELNEMARILKAGRKAVRLRERATETALKRQPLRNYRIVAFATHGVLPGELPGVAEAGLILTPPARGTTQDDGFLSASEVAQLRLNADWVILSACNTAASDGTPGAEGLSGLAKAFFHAGARSLLVSHWPVASDAAVLLTTRMLGEFEAHPAMGKAQAHRNALLSLLDNPERPDYAHPLYWAPFVVVGEGDR